MMYMLKKKKNINYVKICGIILITGGFMFDETKVKILKKLMEKAYPGREIDIQKIGPKIVIMNNDSVGCRDFKLKGQYSYNQVMELNTLTGYSAGFGYCKELGSVAFIGVPNPRCVQASGYFKYNVQEYGKNFNDEEIYFEQYSDEMAKMINSYTVYGMHDPRILNGAAPIDKVKYYHDYRYQRKDEFKEGFNKDVLEMDIKLAGTYDFYEARKLAYSSTKEFKGASGEDVPIKFAIVDEKDPVGIMNLWNAYEDAKFRDVWAKDEPEPAMQTIRFLTDDEAKKIKNFKLYYFTPTHSFGKKKFTIEKKDRTLEENFDFTMADGHDYRLKDCEKTKENVKVKTIGSLN